MSTYGDADFWMTPTLSASSLTLGRLINLEKITANALFPVTFTDVIIGSKRI
jgi:hypothetical protein